MLERASESQAARPASLPAARRSVASADSSGTGAGTGSSPIRPASPITEVPIDRNGTDDPPVRSRRLDSNALTFPLPPRPDSEAVSGRSGAKWSPEDTRADSIHSAVVFSG